VAHTLGHAMITTSVGDFRLKMLLFIFKGCRSTVMIKRSP